MDSSNSGFSPYFRQKDYAPLQSDGPPGNMLSQTQHGGIQSRTYGLVPPIVTQPTAPRLSQSVSGESMIHPGGLEQLIPLDYLSIQYDCTCCQVIKFSINNSFDQEVYSAEKDDDLCSSPFDVRIFDSYKREVLHLKRPLTCGNWCLSCLYGMETMELFAPTGNLIGSIQSDVSLMVPCYIIKNRMNGTIGRIKGIMCDTRTYKVFSLTGEQVGKISNQPCSFMKMDFPMGLDVEMKAMILGAAFLIGSYNRSSRCV